ncbi:unnamed protein product [Acanthosepion pharaonis]|uniref:Uncharacterized protein n=1 Tax=Acanthosepion pharaonis TaxID=158019 RepID=A0A812B206_ACAPH|nr:unnamed protein product [Sepia pharaonis]
MNPPNVVGANVGPSGRYMSDQRHLICPSKQGISWPTAVSKTHADKIRSAHINQPSRQSHSADILPVQQKRSASLPQTQSPSKLQSQNQIQEEPMSRGSVKNKSHEITSEYHNQQSPKMIHRESRDNRDSGSKTQVEEATDVYTSQYCNPRLKQSEQPTQETEMKPLGQTVNYPSDTTIVARGFYTPSLTQNTDNKDSVTEDSNSSDIKYPKKMTNMNIEGR